MTFDAEVRAGDIRLPIVADMLGIHDQTVLLLSYAAKPTVAEAVSLAFTADMAAKLSHPGGDAEKCGRGYSVLRHKGARASHIILVAKNPALLPEITDDALWERLSADRITTPLQRAWMPWVRVELFKAGLLREIVGVGCRPGLLTVTSGDLDRIATRGVRMGKLKIER